MDGNQHMSTAASQRSLEVVVRLEDQGPELIREPVTLSDLADLKSEAWAKHFLRKGRPSTPLDVLRMRLEPIWTDDDTGKCVGFRIGLTGEGEDCVWSDFTIYSLDRVGHRASRRLLERGLVREGQPYVYNVYSVDRPMEARPDTGQLQGTVCRRTRSPLSWLSVPLQPLLEKSRFVGDGLADGIWLPVVYVAKAALDAERFSREGGRGERPVETGAALIGSLASCPDTGEFFVIVLEAVELANKGTQATLHYSSTTWTRIQNVIKARQAQPQTRSQRMVGQAHGHNFLPHYEDGGSCADCDQRETCQLTSVFTSQDDLNWCRAVFTAQPWALCHIFGVDARGANVQSLFGVKDGRLAARPFHIINEFDPTDWTVGDGQGV